MASDPSFHKRFGHRAERFSNEESRFANVMSALSVWGLAGSTLMIILWIVAGGYVLSPIPWPPPGWTVLAAVAFAGSGLWLLVQVQAQGAEDIELTLRELADRPLTSAVGGGAEDTEDAK
jgi:hypothetical protein